MLLKNNCILKRFSLTISQVSHRYIATTSIYPEEFRQLNKVTKLPIIHHEKYVCPLPKNHQFKMEKFKILYKILVEECIINEKEQVIYPNPIAYELCCSIHSPEYVNKFFNGLTSSIEQRISGFKWTPGLVDRVRYETGGTLLAAKLALDRGLACSTGGGTHHAFPEHGSGYCLINDLAVTSQTLINEELVTKVLIVDLDVHQGDGTAFIFRNNQNVYTFSMHCKNNFPIKKQKSDLDIELESHISDDKYMKILDNFLPSVIDSFRPDLIIYDAGVDPHIEDRLGKLDLTTEGLYTRDIYVLKAAICRGIPVATVIGGGYDDIFPLSSRHTLIHRACTEIWNNYF